MTKATEIKKALTALTRPGKEDLLSRFFKTGPGQYGEGDVFIGLTVPDQRLVAKKYSGLSLSELELLLASHIHEHRLTGLLILVEKFKIAADKKKLLQFYLRQSKAVNNWDLVDLTAEKIVGQWVLASQDFALLDKLACSKNMWQRRIAMVSTLALIREHKFEQTWCLAEQFLTEKHDLMHKATGWMLREAGKRDQMALIKFLDQHATKMPRTMLRYAIEKFPEQQRLEYLKKKKL